MAECKRLFVTVGTTEFNKLINTLNSDSTLNVLKENGYRNITLQVGRGESCPEELCDENFTMKVYRYKSSLTEDIQNSDLIISHAGAGSCLEVLEAGKPLVVVINDDLMENHQLELAKKLHDLGHVYYTTCRNLNDTLQSLDLSILKKFEKGHPKKFANFINKSFGLQ